MTLRYSNSQLLTVLDPLPLDGIGWYARILSERDYASQIALVDRFVGLGFTKEESGVGGGKLTLDAGDRIFTDPLPAGESVKIQDQEALIQIIEDGIVRYEFLAEDLAEDVLTEDGKLTTEITGRGTASVLAWAPVLPAGMPVPKTLERKFTAAPMAVWVSLFQEAQANGYLPWVSLMFDGSADTAGIGWTAAQKVTVQAGSNLLDLLTQFCDAEGYVWRMLPGFRLAVLKNPGQNREQQVLFTMYRDQTEQTRAVTRREIGNVVYASDGKGIAVASDTSSSDRFRKRAKWVDAGGTDASGRSTVANTVLSLSKAEQESRTLKIEPLRAGKRLFVDFDVSDTVGIELPDGSTGGARKVMAVTVDVDENGVVTPELTLQSRFESRQVKQQKMLSALGAQTTSAAGAAKIPMSAALAVGSIGDLSDVNLTGAAAGDVLMFDGSGVVDATPNLNLLADVTLGTPSNGQVLTFDTPTGQWRNATPAAGGGGGGGSSAPSVTRFRGAWMPSVYTAQVINFESGTLPAGWTFSGGTPTVVSLADPVAGTTKAMQFPATANNASSKATFTLNWPANNVDYLVVRYKVSSEGNFDFFSVFVDSVLAQRDSGLQTIFKGLGANLANGSRSIELRYSKDGSGAAGSDTAWVSQVAAYTATGGDPYVAGDGVIYNGLAYVLTGANPAATPGTTADWTLMPSVVTMFPPFFEQTAVDGSSQPVRGVMFVCTKGCQTALLKAKVDARGLTTYTLGIYELNPADLATVTAVTGEKQWTSLGTVAGQVITVPLNVTLVAGKYYALMVSADNGNAQAYYMNSGGQSFHTAVASTSYVSTNSPGRSSNSVQKPVVGTVLSKGQDPFAVGFVTL